MDAVSVNGFILVLLLAPRPPLNVSGNIKVDYIPVIQSVKARLGVPRLLFVLQCMTLRRVFAYGSAHI
jgi:hypothetical protein